MPSKYYKLKIKNKISQRKSRENKKLIQNNNQNGYFTDNSDYDLDKMMKNSKLLNDSINFIDKEKCDFCNEIPIFKSVQRYNDKNICTKCLNCLSNNRPLLYTKDNNMDFGIIPDELKNLTMIEQLLIAIFHPIVQIFFLKGGQIGYRGHCVSFFQDIYNFCGMIGIFIYKS